MTFAYLKYLQVETCQFNYTTALPCVSGGGGEGGEGLLFTKEGQKME